MADEIAKQEGFTVEDGMVYYQGLEDSERIKVFDLASLETEIYPTKVTCSSDTPILIKAPEIEGYDC